LGQPIFPATAARDLRNVPAGGHNLFRWQRFRPRTPLFARRQGGRSVPEDQNRFWSWNDGVISPPISPVSPATAPPAPAAH